MDADNIELELQNNLAIQAWSSRLLADGMIASARSTRGVRINGIDLDSEAKLTPIASHIIEGFGSIGIFYGTHDLKSQIDFFS